MAEVGIVGQEPPRELWQSDYLEWIASCTWHCLICDAVIHSVSGLRWCPNCEFKGFASTAQPVSITEEELEEETGEIIDDSAYLDEE